jgi:hypothetical protein
VRATRAAVVPPIHEPDADLSVPAGDAFVFRGLVGFDRHSPKKAVPLGTASFCKAVGTAMCAHLAFFRVAGVLRFVGVFALAAFAGCLAVFSVGPFAGVLRFAGVLALAAFAGCLAAFSVGPFAGVLRFAGVLAVAAFAGFFVVFAILIISIRLLNVRMRIDVNHKE